MTDAALAARLLAHDPGLGGILLRARPGPWRDAWLAQLADAFAGRPIRRMPIGIADDRLLGGLDLAATLAAGRPLQARGLLAEADGGVVIVPMAERLPAETAARLAQALDSGTIEASGGPMPARFVLVLLDESVEPGGADGEGVPACLAERVAIHLDESWPSQASDLAESAVADPVGVLTQAADALGVAGVRVPAHAARLARAAADLGCRPVAEADVAVAVRLVLAARATCLPAAAEEPVEAPPTPPAEAEATAPEPGDLDRQTELAVAASRALLPPGVLEMQAGRAARARASGQGAGRLRQSPSSGRRAGVRQGPLARGARLDLVETLKAAAPWQALRRREHPERVGVQVRRDDFRIRRLVRRAQSTTIFLVDASGSAALARLGEAKGAVELLLAQSYVRRDEVALIAFRGAGAELLLPPTRSLARAKRALQDLPGGGGTPLAAGLEAAALLAAATAAKGRTVTTIVLTDGRANVAREGAGDPLADAEVAARAFRLLGLAAVFIDTAPRPRPEGARIAAAMGARLVPLPRADAGELARIVQAA
jgi:magnesium chelatase subunit D